MIHLRLTTCCFFLLLGASCKPKEQYYTLEEAQRMADSSTQLAIEKITKEAALNLEYRKRVETPYQFGVRTGSPVPNPYDTTGYDPNPPATSTNVDSSVTDTATSAPVLKRPLDPRFKKINEQENKK